MGWVPYFHKNIAGSLCVSFLHFKLALNRFRLDFFCRALHTYPFLDHAGRVCSRTCPPKPRDLRLAQNWARCPNPFMCRASASGGACPDRQSRGPSASQRRAGSSRHFVRLATPLATAVDYKSREAPRRHFLSSLSGPLPPPPLPWGRRLWLEPGGRRPGRISGRKCCRAEEAAATWVSSPNLGK